MNLSKLQSEVVAELKLLLEDPRTGLKESSDTNKTYSSILALFEDQIEKAYKSGLNNMFDELCKLAEPDERQPSAGDLNINLDDVHKIRTELIKQGDDNE